MKTPTIDQDEKYVEANPVTAFSETYLAFVKDTGLEHLTNTDHRFIEWLLAPESIPHMRSIGRDKVELFSAVRLWLKKNKHIK